MKIKITVLVDYKYRDFNDDKDIQETLIIKKIRKTKIKTQLL